MYRLIHPVCVWCSSRVRGASVQVQPCPGPCVRVASVRAGVRAWCVEQVCVRVVSVCASVRVRGDSRTWSILHADVNMCIWSVQVCGRGRFDSLRACAGPSRSRSMSRSSMCVRTCVRGAFPADVGELSALVRVRPRGEREGLRPCACACVCVRTRTCVRACACVRAH
jgi:hypothetical protein